MNVQLLAHTHAPEQLVAASAKLCYSAASIADLAAIEADKAAEFINRLPEAHQSPFEHISFTFGIEGVSRAMLAQITRHRIASFSVQSQRYVNMDEFGYVVPPSITANQDVLDEYEHFMNRADLVYTYLRSCGIPRRRCPIRTAERLRDAHDRHNERSRAAAFLLASLLQTCAVGDSRRG